MCFITTSVHSIRNLLKKDKQKIFRLYKELFSEQKIYPNAYPCAIWVTDNANVVLLLDEDDSARYIVYAEPRQ